MKKLTLSLLLGLGLVGGLLWGLPAEAQRPSTVFVYTGDGGLTADLTTATYMWQHGDGTDQMDLFLFLDVTGGTTTTGDDLVPGRQPQRY